ncbi:MAG TPA: ABC transporter substrate-binding protein [Candidatus Flavonifractor avistercoris]|nr:ABC transporter substrate-binding protein [Candidatus Flavonifractor avistercoris]
MEMKKILALGLTAALSLSLLAGCGGGTGTPAETGSAGTDAPAAETGSGSGGSVYYLNFKPEQDAQWQELAEIYTEETGVPVTVVTAASNTYEQTLTSEMAKDVPPTLFHINGLNGLLNWKDFCYDLTGSDILGELSSDSYALTEGDATLAVAMAVESYGLIVNKTLLAEAGYTVEDIQSFDDLKAVAEDITARSGELGFAAFSSAGMDSSSDWRFQTHLANLPIYFEYEDKGVTSTDAIEGTYLDNYKAIFDLYINNSTCEPAVLSSMTGDDSRNEFLAGEAVFFQNGSWEYANLVGDGLFTDDDLAMIPIYIGAGDEANQGLCTGTENYWAVNASADPEDIQATLDFMYWCVTSETGTNAMCGGEGAMPSGGTGMGFVIPFNGGLEPTNLFMKQNDEYTAAGKTPVRWDFTTIPSQTWKNDLSSALTAYAAGTGDWDGVVSAFVDNWASEYAMLGA